MHNFSLVTHTVVMITITMMMMMMMMMMMIIIIITIVIIMQFSPVLWCFSGSFQPCLGIMSQQLPFA